MRCSIRNVCWTDMKLVAALRNFVQWPSNHAHYRIPTNTPPLTAAKYIICWPPYKEHGKESVKTGTDAQRATSICPLVYINIAFSSLPLLFRPFPPLRSSRSPVTKHAQCQHATRIADSRWVWLPNMPEPSRTMFVKFPDTVDVSFYLCLFYCRDSDSCLLRILLGPYAKWWEVTFGVVMHCVFVCLSDRVKQLPLDGFSWNLIFEYFSTICH